MLEIFFLLFHHSINIPSIRSAANREQRRRNDVPMNDINSNHGPPPRDQNQPPFAREADPLSGNQSTSQNST